jgi:hypothetical protein
MPDKTASEGLFDLPYGFASQHMSHVATQSGVPVGFWRSVGHSHNAFFSESFVDELAVATKQDPLAFRLKLLKDAPRYAAVLKLAADKAGWGTPLPAGRARGIALHKSFGAIVAQVAEVSLANGQIRVHRVVCAIDCGTVVNPGTVAQQMQSSVVYACSAKSTSWAAWCNKATSQTPPCSRLVRPRWLKPTSCPARATQQGWANRQCRRWHPRWAMRCLPSPASGKGPCLWWCELSPRDHQPHAAS